MAAVTVLAAGAAAASAAPAAGVCPPSSRPTTPVALGTAEWNGWGRDVDNNRYQPEPALRAADVPKLAVKWAYAMAPADAYGQPTVVGGRVFVTSSAGWVYSLDARTGCTYWTFDAAAPVDTPIVVGELGKPVLIRPRWRRWHRQNAHIPVIEPPSALIFGDGSGNVYALDAERGTLLWKVAAGASMHGGVSGAPAVYDGRVYVLLTSAGFTHGAVASLDLATGALLWESPIPRSTADPADGGAIAGTPTVDPRRASLYVAVGGAVVALDLTDGRPRWVAPVPPPNRPDPADDPVTDTAAPAGNPPILQSLADGRQVLLSANAAGIAYALDPDRNGALLWQAAVLRGTGGVEWAHASDHRDVYVAFADRSPQAGSDNAALASLAIASGKVRWLKRASQPTCAVQGRRCAPAHAHALTVIPGIVFSGSIDGHLRAYSTIDGMAVWDYDTARSFQTINGGAVRGGSLGRDGPTVVDGIAYLESVDRGAGGATDGVLLAFSVDAK